VRPANGAVVHAPVFVQAIDASGRTPVAMQVDLDSVMVEQVAATSVLGTTNLSATATITVL